MFVAGQCTGAAGAAGVQPEAVAEDSAAGGRRAGAGAVPIEFASFAAAAPTAEALAAGAVDIGSLGDAPFVFAAAAGAPLKTVGVIKLKVTPTAVAIVVKEDRR